MPKSNLCEERELGLCSRIFGCSLGFVRRGNHGRSWVEHQMLPRNNPKAMHVELYYDLVATTLRLKCNYIVTIIWVQFNCHSYLWLQTSKYMIIVQLTHDIHETLVNCLYFIQRSNTSWDYGILSSWMNTTLRSYVVDVDSLLLCTKPS
jgi:hypothetical protein